MNTRSFGFLIALAVALVVTPAWSEDIAGNGGFESAGGGGATDSDLWSEFGPTSERDSSNPSSGSWAHRMYTQGGGSSGINQSSIADVGLSSLEENTTVTVSMDVEANYGPGGVGFAVLRILNGVGAIVAETGLQNVPAGPYQTWTLPPVTVPAYGAAPNNVYAAFVEINAVSGAFAESTSEVFVDNVMVDATLGDGGPEVQLSPYSQDFETLDPAPTPPEPGSLGQDGWLAFVNAFDAPGGNRLYGYGPFPTPQGGPAFAGVASGEGGPDQGAQQLSIYSDYNNGDHANGIWIEANVFQEQIVGAGNVGDTWIFGFDTKRGNINDNPDLPPAEALAFIKTLDPNNGFALTNFIVFDTTNEDDVWSRYELTIEIDASLPGQILQFGFLNLSTLFQSTGVFYDNVTFEPVSSGACCSALDQCIEVPVTECIGSYQGDGTTCDIADCSGPLKVVLCHIPPGNPENPQTVQVSLNAAAAHLNHGDYVGPCGGSLGPAVTEPTEGPFGGSMQLYDLQQSSTTTTTTTTTTENDDPRPTSRPRAIRKRTLHSDR